MIKEKIKFGIDRKEISHFTSIELTQTINNHHYFKISVPHSVIENPRSYTIENAQNWLGKAVHIALENSNDFLGIITNVQFTQELDHVGNQIVLTGYSKTILLESGKKLFSWEDSTLQDIVRETIKAAGVEGRLEAEIKPEYDSKFEKLIEYQTQYLETDFQYIKRLAKQYNEWLYYDGEKLIFGMPDKFQPEITLIFGKDLFNLNIAVQATPNEFSGFTYNEDFNTLYQGSMEIDKERLSRLDEASLKASKDIFATPTYEYGRVVTGYDSNLELMLKMQHQAAISDSNYITATSSNNKLRIGNIITVQAEVEMDVNTVAARHLDLKKKHYRNEYIGSYIITEITHKATDIGEYQNSFKGIPYDVKKLPEPQVEFPQAQTQQAIVIDNADPKNQGRIRVSMLWQQNKNLRTPWLRVMTPDAGTSGEVSKNRGMVFIPEKGDHVMLGFRYNDPNRPFVMGSLFNGKIAAGGQAQNNIKSIFTRTGSTITFDEGASSILVKDPSGNTWFMDGAGNIEVTAPNDITFNAGKNLNINVGENMSTNVGMNKTDFIAMNQTENVGMIKTTAVSGDANMFITGKLLEMIEGDVHSETKNGKTVVNSSEGIESSASGVISYNAQKKIENNGGEKSNNY